jgi:hypothetical protein
MDEEFSDLETEDGKYLVRSGRVIVRVSNGEYILNAAAVARLNVGFLDRMNSVGFRTVEWPQWRSERRGGGVGATLQLWLLFWLAILFLIGFVSAHLGGG